MKKETDLPNQTAAKPEATTAQNTKIKKSVNKVEVTYLPDNIPIEEIKQTKSKRKKAQDGGGELNVEQLW